jgi:hypothetical protein
LRDRCLRCIRRRDVSGYDCTGAPSIGEHVLAVGIAGFRDLLQFVGVTLSLSAGAVVVGWFRQEMRSKRSSPRVLETAAAAFFLAATAGIAIATLTTGPASALAAMILIGCGLAAHACGFRRAGAMLRQFT